VRAPLVRSEDVPRLRDFALFRECEHCPEMVVLPAGTFLMGSPQNEADRDDDEDSAVGPGGEQVRVRVSRFAIGRFELTAAEWFACVDAGGGCDDRPAVRDVWPVASVTWNSIPAYMTWLNGQAGGGTTLVRAGGAGAYRLPSEAEWEYAARAETTTAYAFGDDPAGLGDYAWFNGNIEGRPPPVGSKSANQFGLYDSHGSVSEWVQDCYADSYAALPRDGSAYATEECSDRVLRGGSSFNFPQSLRSADRNGDNPDNRFIWVGVRVARTL
jgi:formylglycine-generating enzyme required for sulfatase activity